MGAILSGKNAKKQRGLGSFRKTSLPVLTASAWATCEGARLFRSGRADEFGGIP
jgi:hypothetical protein